MNIPNLLTFFRLLIIPIIIYTFFRYPVVSLVLFVIACLTDYFDGYIARKNHEETILGAFLDSLADKLLIIISYYLFFLIGIIPLWIWLLMVIREVAITVMRVWVIKKKDIRAKIHGKSKMLVQTFLGIYGYLVIILRLNPFTFFILSIFMLILTYYSGIRYIIEGFKDL